MIIPTIARVLLLERHKFQRGGNQFHFQLFSLIAERLAVRVRGKRPLEGAGRARKHVRRGERPCGGACRTDTLALARGGARRAPRMVTA